MKLAIRSTLYVVVLTILLGGLYPAAVTGVSRVFWKDKADGSFVSANGRAVGVGSELIGQNFKGAGVPALPVLQPRARTATTAQPRRAPTRGRPDAGLARIHHGSAVAAARVDRPGDPRPRARRPRDDSSASGLDPHLSPDAAFWQARPHREAARGVRGRDAINHDHPPATSSRARSGLLGEPQGQRPAHESWISTARFGARP